MKKINVDDLEWEIWASPKGKFRGDIKEISAALGAKRNSPVGSGGHAFDLALERLAPGASACPYHRHAAQTEMFYILSGDGSVRADGATFAVRAGDVVLHPPGEAHQIINAGSEDLVYAIIADNPPVDVCDYPDSNKTGIFGESTRRLVRTSDVDYWDGEE